MSFYLAFRVALRHNVTRGAFLHLALLQACASSRWSFLYPRTAQAKLERGP